MVATPFADLEDGQFDELRRLFGVYHREAQKCKATNAYLAGCVMFGAALETALLMNVHCFQEEVATSPKAPRAKSGALKPLLAWNLNELVQVAKCLHWLPAGLDPEHDDWDAKRAKVGDYAEVVRQLRNLLHPRRYMCDHSRRSVTKNHLELSFEVLAAAMDHIYEKLAQAIREELERDEGL